ncbi:hypothetical protein GCM10007103_10020 [Salinimicrobium marinum]|uniref:THUMP-like domain-containing protein n=1 Tax=Salinimicrobium marinum TaxID=680283 RepID=A0A918S9T7_9FLAO|nr:class I SAM-dependent methyltransferase [Salinimicrobium marinum]GHA30562.1 hypothetical protein GCM10007103_10020 [Salinimicrobium marinum]
MNRALLHKKVQDFIQENYKEDISKIVLKGSPFEDVTVQELAIQLHGKRKAEKKLPTWFHSKGIIYPPKLNLEQTSSEKTAKYKASLINGENLLDITGGFGIDSYFFSKNFEKVVHCELDPSLSEVVAHNYSQQEIRNVELFPGDGIEFLEHTNHYFSWIYIDPSRRNDSRERVFHLSDCLPNVPQHLDLLFKKTSGIMIKTSPLLDLQAGLFALKKVAEIHIIAVDNDVKELLWILEKNASETVQIKTFNFTNKGTETYNNIFGNFSEANYSEPLSYLYEPNAAIMKSGLFGALGEAFDLPKLHSNSHLFTSEKFKENFPGRKFEILEVLPFNRKKLKKHLKMDKANITTRNFPESVERLRQHLKLKEGGEHYLFFTTTIKEEKICIICAKA